jgi:hypothetical protein
VLGFSFLYKEKERLEDLMSSNLILQGRNRNLWKRMLGRELLHGWIN